MVGLLQWPSTVYAVTNPVRPPASHSTAPVKLPRSSGEPAATQPRPVKVGERPDLRGRSSSTRLNADHTSTTTASTHPVNYRDAGGAWQPIDATRVAAGAGGYAWANGAGTFKASLKSQLDAAFLRIELPGVAPATLSLEGASRSQGKASGNRVTYPGVLPGTDLTYDIGADAMKETLVLNGASAPTTYQFLLDTPKGVPVVPSARFPGAWELVVPGKAALLFAAPQVQESASAGQVAAPETAPVALAARLLRAGEYQLTLTVDATWLHDPGRHFPVLLDPTIQTLPDTGDTSFKVCSGCTSVGGTTLLVGADNTSVYRAGLSFDLSSIPPGAQVTSAALSVTVGQDIAASNPSSSFQVDAHRVTSTWSPGTALPSFDSTVLSSATINSGATGTMTWDVTGTVTNWLNGSQPNFGLLLQRSTEAVRTGGPAPFSGSYGDPASQPRLVVNYKTDAVLLRQPQVLHANGAELSWTQFAPDSGAAFQKYEVHRSATPNFTPSAANLLTQTNDVTATTYRDVTASPGGTFSYAVVANSSKSNEVKVTLPADGQGLAVIQPGPADLDAQISQLVGSGPGTGTSCMGTGSATEVAAGSVSDKFGDTTQYRSLFEFDLGQIASSATVGSATLTLTHPETAAAGTESAFQVTRAWLADQANWCEASAGVLWTSATGAGPGGGDFNGPALSTVTVAQAGEGPTSHSFDVTSAVRQWLSGQAPNFGLLVDSTNYIQYASSAYTADARSRPTLTIHFSDGSHAIPPAVSMSTPAPGATVTGSSVTLSAAASGDNPVSQVQFFVDGSAVGSASQAPWQVTWNSASVGNGSHTITARATDSAGNSTTSAATGVTVNNFPSPTTAITSPANNAGGLTGAVTVATSDTVAGGLSVGRVELYVDGALTATATASPWSLSWNTLDPNLPAYDGSHTLVSRVYDSSGLVASSSPVSVTVANTAGTRDQAAFDPAVVPQAVSFDPNAQTQLTYPVNVAVTNTSGQTWSASTTTLRYRWYLAGSSTSFADSGDVASLGLTSGQKQTVQVNVTPPALTAGIDAARFTLRFDVVDSAGASPTFMASAGNQPLDNPVIVNKVLSANIGLEHFWQFTSQPAGAGITQMTNIANGNSVLSLTPLSEPGRGLSTVVDLTYNSLEEHSDSPAGNNWSLSITGLTRFGDPLDVHPNNADTIAGRSNKFIDLVDGTGRLLTFTGVTGSDGVTFWEEPPGVHLYLRQVSTDTALQGRFWAITRPDRVTFFYDSQGFPTAVTDKNGNTLSYTLTAVQPGDDPGGPKFHVTRVTDAGGRSFNVTYFTKATARKPQIRGKVASITDHLFDPNVPGQGRELDFAYYDDGNLLSITDRGGHNADGSFLPDRSTIFTYTTSDGSGPAISDPNARVSPDPKTSNESTKIFSVRDYNGHETTFAYDGPGSSIDRWKLASITDRAANTTSFGYDDVNLVTTVAKPTPAGQTARTYRYAYDVQGRPTQITDPLSGTTSFQWTPDNAVTQLTEPNNATRKFTYNDNGYPTDVIDELGDHTILTYQNIAVDANDVSAHWNPAGGANGTGRTIPHISQLATKQDPNAVKAGTSDKWSYQYSTDGKGNLIGVSEPLGNNTTATASTAYNPDGTVASTTDFLTNQTTYLSYDANGLPTKIADATDSATSPAHPLQIGYDAAGRTLFVQDENHASFTGGTAADYQTQFLYDTFGRMGRQTTPKSTSLSLGTLVESDTTYDPNDNVLSVVAPHCVPAGACTNESAASNVGTGDTATTAYDVMDRKVLDTDPSNNKTGYAYDVAGRLTQVTLPLGELDGTPNNTRTVNYGYDALDRTIIQAQNHINADGTVSALDTLACYNSVGDMVSVTQPKAGLSSLTCPGTTSTPFTTVYSYDTAHHLTGSTDADGHSSASTYDANGNRITGTDANNNTTNYTYDTLNRLTQTSTPFITGGSPHPVVSKTVYDADGNVIQSLSPRAVDCTQVSRCVQANPNGYVTTNHYDKLNRLVRQDLPVDGTFTTQYYVHKTYDFNGNLLSTSLPATQSDPMQVPASLQTASTYFDTGWISTEQVGTDPILHYDYNGKGQQTLRVPNTKSGSLDLANEVFWSFQSNGLLASRKDQQGQPITYQYDADGNLTVAVDASGLTDPSQTPVTTQSAYDDLDRLVRSDLKAQSATNWTFSSFTYDLNSNVTDQDQNGQEQSPGGTLVKDGHKLHTDYDAANWLTDQIDNTLNQRTLNTFTPIGLEANREIDQSNGSGGWNLLQQTSWSYFANGQLSGLTTVAPTSAPCAAPCSATTTIEKHTVSYLDANGVYLDGNRTQDVYSLRPGGTGTSPCFPGTCTGTYAYDPQDRLVSSTDGHGGATTYTLDGPGNILTQTVGGTTTTNTYSGNQLQQSVTGSQTLKYWYDDLGRQQCVTDVNGTQANCAPAENATASTDLVSDNHYDYLDRLQTFRAYSGGNRTDEANYVYDAQNRQVQESEQHPSFNGDTRVTAFSYLGTSNLDVEEQQSSRTSGNTLSVKDFTYDVNGNRLAETNTPYANGQPGTPTAYTYGYDVHGSVSQLVDPTGKTTASYGYTPYGESDTQLSQGDTNAITLLNPFRYSAKRLDTGSGTLDMGVRRFGPDTSHFLTPDFFYGSLSNLDLSMDPTTGNRYDLAGGNPISFKESDGHVAVADGGGGAATDPSPPSIPAAAPAPTSVGRSNDGPSGGFDPLGAAKSVWQTAQKAWDGATTAVGDKFNELRQQAQQKIDQAKQDAQQKLDTITQRVVDVAGQLKRAAQAKVSSALNVAGRGVHLPRVEPPSDEPVVGEGEGPIILPVVLPWQYQAKGRTWKCTVRCNLEPLPGCPDPSACYRNMTVDAQGPTQKACKMAGENAVRVAAGALGCRTRHCHVIRMWQ